MKKLLIISILSSLLFSCTSNTIMKKPTDLIPKDTMELIITDILIAGAASNETSVEQRKNINYIQFVSDKYNVDSARFQRSNLYYISKIDDYEKMLKQVKTNLEEMKAILDEENKKINASKKKLVERNKDSKQDKIKLDPENETNE